MGLKLGQSKPYLTVQVGSMTLASLSVLGVGGISITFSQKENRLGVAVHACSPRTWGLRYEDCRKSEASLGYKVSSGAAVLQ